MTAFAKFVFTRVLNVCFKVALFGCNGPGEFLGMILVSFFIGALVLIILTLIKKGVKIMKNEFRKALDRGQKPKVNNKTRNEAKVHSEWV